MKQKFVPQKCTCCGQTVDYALTINQGTVDILKAISVAIRNKGINCIHPRKEMEIHTKQLPYQIMVQAGQLTSNQVGNLSKARMHGLIAKVRGENGNYLLTRKGVRFLKGEPIPRMAIISKMESRTLGYFNEETDMVTIKDYIHKEEYWEGINYRIVDGRIIKNL